MRELNDNPDLQRLAGRMLALITSITPALEMIEPVMDALISILENSSVSYSVPVLPWKKLICAVMEDENAQYARALVGLLPKFVSIVRDL